MWVARQTAVNGEFFEKKRENAARKSTLSNSIKIAIQSKAMMVFKPSTKQADSALCFGSSFMSPGPGPAVPEDQRPLERHALQAQHLRRPCRGVSAAEGGGHHLHKPRRWEHDLAEHPVVPRGLGPSELLSSFEPKSPKKPTFVTIEGDGLNQKKPQQQHLIKTWRHRFCCPDFLFGPRTRPLTGVFGMATTEAERRTEPRGGPGQQEV